MGMRIILICLLSMIVWGCSNSLPPMSPAVQKEYDRIQETREYDRLAKIEEDRDQLRAKLIACRDAHFVALYDGSWLSASERRRFDDRRNKRKGYPYIPKHLKAHDVACLRPGDAKEWLDRQLGGY